jgi:POT family proton-dependent oligopeptide transporter
MTNDPRIQAEQAAVPGANQGVPAEVWFGHPRGLSTLFFTEMWERFSYYGMRALLVLFMTAPLTGLNPGLGFDVAKSTAIYGLYTSLVYLVALPGGWVADKLWGQRKAVFVGGCIIAAGHFAMAVPAVPTFYLGLLLIIIGTGLLKPNVSTMVGELYPEGGARRDAGFSVFYMGINAGALLGTTLCGVIGEGHNFHWGFSLAGIGMVLGLVQYRFGRAYLGGVGELKSNDSPQDLARRGRTFWATAAAVGVVLAVLTASIWSGILAITIQQVAAILGYGILVVSGLPGP